MQSDLEKFLEGKFEDFSKSWIMHSSDTYSIVNIIDLRLAKEVWITNMEAFVNGLFLCIVGGRGIGDPVPLFEEFYPEVVGEDNSKLQLYRLQIQCLVNLVLLSKKKEKPNLDEFAELFNKLISLGRIKTNEELAGIIVALSFRLNTFGSRIKTELLKQNLGVLRHELHCLLPSPLMFQTNIIYACWMLKKAKITSLFTTKSIK